MLGAFYQSADEMRFILSRMDGMELPEACAPWHHRLLYYSWQFYYYYSTIFFLLVHDIS